MADTNKTIKNATDQELSELLNRIRREQEALRMIRELKLKSTPNPDGVWPTYSMLESLSTETSINNGPSIKEMTDKELMTFIHRLETENELARVILDIKTMNTPVIDTNGMYPEGKPYEGISLDTPVKDLYHIGIVGMRWGVRRASEDHSVSNSLRKHKTPYLSNAELTTVTKRLGLERQYRDLRSDDFQKGFSFVKTITAIGATVASLYALSETSLGKKVVSGLKGNVKIAVTKAAKVAAGVGVS